jgi:hypothetical protein
MDAFAMTKSELRAWIRARAITQAEAAALLGLSLPTLVRQITDAPSGVPVGRQTAIICRLFDRFDPAADVVMARLRRFCERAAKED